MKPKDKTTEYPVTSSEGEEFKKNYFLLDDVIKIFKN